MSNLFDCRGKLYIAETFFDQELEKLAEMLSMIRFVPMLVDLDVKKQAFMMYGASNRFRPIGISDKIPSYTLEIKEQFHPTDSKLDSWSVEVIETDFNDTI